jgi:hypothetical protein
MNTQRRFAVAIVAIALLLAGVYAAQTQAVHQSVDETNGLISETPETQAVVVYQSEVDGTYALRLLFQSDSLFYVFPETQEVDATSILVTAGSLAGETQRGTLQITNGSHTIFSAFFEGRMNEQFLFPTPLKFREGDRINLYLSTGTTITGGVSVGFVGRKPPAQGITIN